MMLRRRHTQPSEEAMDKRIAEVTGRAERLIEELHPAVEEIVQLLRSSERRRTLSA